MGTLRRLLDSLSVLVVKVDPVNLSSFVDTPFATRFLPFASRARILARLGSIAGQFADLFGLSPISLDELIEIDYLKSKGAAHFHERNPSLINPPVKR